MIGNLGGRGTFQTRYRVKPDALEGRDFYIPHGDGMVIWLTRDKLEVLPDRYALEPKQALDFFFDPRNHLEEGFKTIILRRLESAFASDPEARRNIEKQIAARVKKATWVNNDLSKLITTKGFQSSRHWASWITRLAKLPGAGSRPFQTFLSQPWVTENPKWASWILSTLRVDPTGVWEGALQSETWDPFAHPEWPKWFAASVDKDSERGAILVANRYLGDPRAIAHPDWEKWIWRLRKVYGTRRRQLPPSPYLQEAATHLLSLPQAIEKETWPALVTDLMINDEARVKVVSQILSQPGAAKNPAFPTLVDTLLQSPAPEVFAALLNEVLFKPEAQAWPQWNRWVADRLLTDDSVSEAAARFLARPEILARPEWPNWSETFLTQLRENPRFKSVFFDGSVFFHSRLRQNPRWMPTTDHLLKTAQENPYSLFASPSLILGNAALTGDPQVTALVDDYVARGTNLWPLIRDLFYKAPLTNDPRLPHWIEQIILSGTEDEYLQYRLRHRPFPSIQNYMPRWKRALRFKPANRAAFLAREPIGACALGGL